MIDIRKLKELVRLMVENDLSELDLKDQQETVTIKRAGAAPVVHHAPGHVVMAPIGTPAAAGSGAAGSVGSMGEGSIAADGNGMATTEKPAPEDLAGLVEVKSPMVGTLYLSPNPDAPQFVTAGSSVGPDTTVCIIEAMKVFNEIKAEVAGVIDRVLVENGRPVEYGQRMFLVRPA